ncbi:MAG: hypothetical protein ACHQ50_16110, partial [Fimbriimonadales bacterium]
MNGFRRLRHLLTAPWNVRAASFTSFVGWMAAMAILWNSVDRQPSWLVDEGIRTAETYFFGLASRGDFGNVDWVRYRDVSSQPILNDYAMGLSIRLHRRPLPQDIGDLYPRIDKTGDKPDRDPILSATLLPLRAPARRAALAFNLATAFCCVGFALAFFGGIGGLMVALPLAGHYLSRMLLTDAVGDPLQILLVSAAIFPCWIIWSSRGKRLLNSCGAVGALAAGAFLIRPSGLIVLLPFALVLTARAGARASQIAVEVLVAGGVCLCLATLLNPYYWTRVTSPLAPEEFRRVEALPERVFSRFRLQLLELGRQTRQQDPRFALQSPATRAAFIG